MGWLQRYPGHPSVAMRCSPWLCEAWRIRLPLAIGLEAWIASRKLVLSTQTLDPSAAAVTSIAKPTSASHAWPQPRQQRERSILHVRSPQRAGGLGKAPATLRTPRRGERVGPNATGAVQGSFQHTEAYFSGSQKPHSLEPVQINYNQMSRASAERRRDRKYEVRNNQKHPNLEIVIHR